jgi:hypothetical protein
MTTQSPVTYSTGLDGPYAGSLRMSVTSENIADRHDEEGDQAVGNKSWHKDRVIRVITLIPSFHT